MGKVYLSDKNIAVLEDTLKEWKKKLNLYRILYIYAMSGFGKTVSAVTFAERQFLAWKIISAEDDEFLLKAENYIRNNKNTRVKTLLILDDMQWLLDGKKQKLIELLDFALKINEKIQILLLSRSPLPHYLMKFKYNKQLTIENKEVLFLEESQINELIKAVKLPEKDNKPSLIRITKECMQVTKGYPVAVDIYIEQLLDGQYNLPDVEAIARKKTFQYLDNGIFSKWTNEKKDAMLKLAVFPKFNIYMAEYILGPSAKEILKDIMKISSFLNFKAPDFYEINPFFLNYLKLKQKEISKDKRNFIYLKAGSFYEKKRNYKEALRCYMEAGENNKAAELLIYMNENADGCDFARISGKYLDALPDFMEEKYPKILGARVMQLSYQMKLQESKECMENLKKKAEEENKQGKTGEALLTYIRTLIALPHRKAGELLTNFSCITKYEQNYGIHIENIIPTGNMPSVLNGGLDLSEWVKNDKNIYPIMKVNADIIGKEAIGIADVCVGEIQYEKNNRTEAMAHLVKGLSDADYKGSIRVQYAANAVIARLFQSEGQLDTAAEILNNVKENAEKKDFWELLPNIRASLALCSLLKGDRASVEDWFINYAPDEHDKFYITDRFQLLTKVKVLISMKRYMEALFIINLLEVYTKLHDRKYINMELGLLRAIIFYRREEEWQAILLNTVKKAAEFSYIRILADQGAALLPLWKCIDWKNTDFKSGYIELVYKELIKMADCYPDYLKVKKDINKISRKELDVLRLIAEGHNNKEISKLLDISTGTVKFHIGNLLKKLKAENRTMAVKIAEEEKLL